MLDARAVETEVSYVGGAVVAGAELLVKGGAEENKESVSIGAEETMVVPSQDSCPYPPQEIEGVSVAGGLETSGTEDESTSGTEVAGVSVVGGVDTEASVVEESGTSWPDEMVTSVVGAEYTGG